MRKYIFAYLSFLLLNLFTFNPCSAITFEKWFGGTSYDWCYSVQQTDDGGYIITGLSYSYGAGNNDVYLIKTTTEGDTIWTKTFGGISSDCGHSVSQTTDGGYIITGYTDSYGAGSYDVYLIKTDSNGDTLWTKTYGGSSFEKGESVFQTTDGGYIITGYTTSYGTGGDVYLIKTNSSGTTVWTKNYGGTSYDYGYSVAQTTDSGYIITGGTDSYGAGNPDVYLIKTDPSGDTIWTKTFGGTSSDYSRSVAQTTDGGYIITGSTYSYGAGTPDYSNIYLIKTTSSGATVWTKTFGGTGRDYGYSVAQTTDGGYIIAGETDSYGAGAYDVYLIKTNSSGDTIWTKTFGGTSPDYGYSVAQSSDGGYIITGGTNSYGAGTPQYDNVYLIKTDENGSVGIEEDSNSQLSTPAQLLEVYPNPFTTTTVIRAGFSCSLPSRATITIHDIAGRLVETTKDKTIGKNLNAGIYFLKAKGSDNIGMKIVKLK